HGIRPNPQHPILGLQHHFNPRRNIIRNQRRHANAKVHVEPIAQLTRNPFNDTLALVDVFPWLSNHFLNSVIVSSRRIPCTRSVSLPSSFMLSILGTRYLPSSPSASQFAAHTIPPEKSASHTPKEYESHLRPTLPHRPTARPRRS